MFLSFPTHNLFGHIKEHLFFRYQNFKLKYVISNVVFQTNLSLITAAGVVVVVVVVRVHMLAVLSSNLLVSMPTILMLLPYITINIIVPIVLEHTRRWHRRGHLGPGRYSRGSLTTTIIIRPEHHWTLLGRRDRGQLPGCRRRRRSDHRGRIPVALGPPEQPPDGVLDRRRHTPLWSRGVRLGWHYGVVHPPGWSPGPGGGATLVEHLRRGRLVYGWRGWYGGYGRPRAAPPAGAPEGPPEELRGDGVAAADSW